MDLYVEEIVIRQRLDEARREGERAQLMHRVTAAAVPRRRRAVMQNFVEAISTLWLKGRKERMAVR